MRRVFGPRTVVEAAFLVAVPVLALELGSRWPAIVGASIVGYLFVVLVEVVLLRERRGGARPKLRFPRPTREPKPKPAPEETLPEAQLPEAKLPEATLEATPPKAKLPKAKLPKAKPPKAKPVQPPPVVVVAERKPEPAVEPAPAPEPEPEPEPVRVLQAAPEQAREAVSEAVSERARVLKPVPDPEPEPAPEPEPLAAEGAPVVPIGVSAVPRQWNLWDLERLTREASGGDAILDEERSFLLMYLREFAGADGELPLDFDGLVRDSFGELVGAR